MDKPFKSIQEQVDLIESRGMLVDERTPLVLEREGYYPVVNGYKDIFIDSVRKQAAAVDDRFIEGSSFNQMYALFSFDRNLRMLLFKYLAMAEAALKTVTAYKIAEQYKDSPEPYLDKDIYRQESAFRRDIEILIRDFNKILGRVGVPEDYVPKRAYLQHYIEHHDNVPIWVVLNYATFGMVFKLFCFQKESMRNNIAKGFSDLYAETHDTPIKIYSGELRLAYDHIKDFRNICAHDERLYCARVAKAKDISLADVWDDLDLVLKANDTRQLREEVNNLLDELGKELPPEMIDKVRSAMGF